MNEIVLYDIRKYKRPKGFIKVSCLLENTFDDEDLKDEIIRCLIDTPCADQAVRLIQESHQATPRSALQACINIANDLLANIEGIEPPTFIKEEEDNSRDNTSFAALALQNSLTKVKKQKNERGRHYRHPIVSLKQYTFYRIYYFYADPAKVDQGLPIRFVV